MRSLSCPEELNTLSAERICVELNKALGEQSSWIFFDVLQAIGALAQLFPELADTYSAARERLISTAKHVLIVEQRFALLCYDMSVDQVVECCSRLKLSNAFRDTARVVVQLKSQLTSGLNDASEVYSLLATIDTWRRPERAVDCLNLLAQLEQTADIATLRRMLSTATEISCRTFYRPRI